MDLNTVQPVNDYILVRKSETTMQGGLHLPPGANPIGAREATVVAIGRGRYSEYSAEFIPNLPVAPGGTLLIHGGAGTVVSVGHEELWFILPRDVMAILSGGTD